MHKDIESIVYSEQVLAERIEALGKQISEDYKGKKLIVVGVMKGANVFVADLIRKMDLDIILDFIVVSSYGASTESTGVIRLLKDLDENISSEHVLIVEDIIDSGFPLPRRNMIPITMEEKLICYADKFYTKSPKHLTTPKSRRQIRRKILKYGEDKLEAFNELVKLFGIDYVYE